MTPGDELCDLPLPERIRYVREKHLELSQAKLAVKLGVTERTVKRWEAGDARPEPQTGERLAQLAKLPAEIFDGREEAPTYSRLLARLDSLSSQIADAVRRRDDFEQELAEQLGSQTALLAQLSAAASTLTTAVEALTSVAERLDSTAAALQRAAQKRRPA